MAENPRIEELRRRVDSDPASIAFAALAEEYRRTGRHEEAIETCRTGLQRHPAYLSARVTLGRALIEVGDLDSARTELETVLKTAPENLAAIRGLAQIHERQGHSTEMAPHIVALAATPFPVREPPPADEEIPVPDVALEPQPGPGYADAPAPELSLVAPMGIEEAAPEPALSDLAYAETTEPPTTDLPGWAGGGPEIAFDLPSESVVPETIPVDIPMKPMAVAAADPPGLVGGEISAGPDGEALGRLELFLGAVRHARAELSESLSH